MHANRRALTLVLVTAALAACGDQREPAAETPAESAPAAAPAAEEPQATDWNGTYAVRGTLEGDQVSGTLSVSPLAEGGAGYDEVRTRVQRTYPSYQGPFHAAQLQLDKGGEAIQATFTCANGPAATPPLVCEPTTPLPGLEQVTLVVQPGGRAVLTGSHGEGVSVESGRFTWTRQ